MSQTNTEGAAQPAAEPAHVLVVDDSGIVRRQLRAAFEEAGLKVTEAEEGSEALWRARQGHFDLVITDIHMPAMDGLTFVKEIRELEGYAQVPVLVLTSDSAAERVKEGKRVGVSGWIIKPPQVPALVSGVLNLLRRQSGTSVTTVRDT